MLQYTPNPAPPTNPQTRAHTHQLCTLADLYIDLGASTPPPILNFSYSMIDL